MPVAVAESDLGLKVLVEHGDTDIVEYGDHVRLTKTFFADHHSVVAVHGTAAPPNHTWCKLKPFPKDVERDEKKEKEYIRIPSNYVDWLSDPSMLPSVLPKARIMRFGYRSAWFGKDCISTTPRTISQDLLCHLVRMRKV